MLADPVLPALPIPGCRNPAEAAEYWAFVADAASVKDCGRRIELRRHASTCPACTKALLALLREPLLEAVGEIGEGREFSVTG
jgi:hypothetical protein